MVPSATLRRHLLILLGIAVLAAGDACSRAPAATGASIPRTADGKPNLQGIWQVRNRASYDLEGHVASQGMLAGTSVVQGGPIPVSAVGGDEADRERGQPADGRSGGRLLPARRAAHHVHGLPVPDLPDAAHIAMTFEWSLVHRLISTNGSAARRHRLLDGRLARTLGRRHAGRRRHATTTTRRGSTWPATSTARRCRSSSATR